MDETIETEIYNCPECGKPVETYWTKRGLLPGNYLLIADWIFHPDCWNAVVDRNPP